MTLVPGTYVTHNVRVVRKLGEGGMGTVWIADHHGLETQVVVKFISPELVGGDAAILERFRREAAAAAKVRSPHIVQVFDHGAMADGTPYIVMELLEGESLEERLERLGRLAPQEVVVVVEHLAKALTEAHSRDVIHRDIKPANVFLTSSAGELWAKVLDFGIAKQRRAEVDSLTGTATLIGTPEYMSPEQITTAKGTDHRADLWALSVVAYEALTGRMPFVGETVGGLIVQISNGAFTPPSALGLRLPPALDAWFARAFARSIHERFSSARELAATLGQTLNFNVSSGQWSSPVSGQTEAAGPYRPSDAPAPAPTLFGAPSSVVQPTIAATAPGTLGGAASTLHGDHARKRRRAIIGAGIAGVIAVCALVVTIAVVDGGDKTEDTSDGSSLAGPRETVATIGVSANSPPNSAEGIKAAETTPGAVDDAASESPASSVASATAATTKAHPDSRETSTEPAAVDDDPSATAPVPQRRPPRNRKRRLGF